VRVGVVVITAVATLIIPDRESAQDPAVADIIRRAEAVHRRRRSGPLYPFWKGTPLPGASNAAIAAGKPVGGTSAGLAVQGEFLYAALNDPATRFGIVDERPEVVDHWRDAKSWMVPPVAVACDLLGGGTGLELLIGHTRLGSLMALLDREPVREIQKHLVWAGRVVLRLQCAQSRR
jgi:hypothetical protein